MSFSRSRPPRQEREFTFADLAAQQERSSSGSGPAYEPAAAQHGRPKYTEFRPKFAPPPPPEPEPEKPKLPNPWERADRSSTKPSSEKKPTKEEARKAEYVKSRDEMEKKKAKSKREFDKLEAMRKRTQDNVKIDNLFAVVSKKRPINLDDDDNDVDAGPDFDLDRSSFVDLSLDEKAEEQTSVSTQPVSTSIEMPTDNPRLGIFNDDDQQLKPSDLDWPEMEVVLRMLKKVELGCRSHPSCDIEEHHHDEDDSLIAELLSSIDANPSAPIDPFDREKFPLFSLLPEAFANLDSNQRRTGEPIRMTSADVLRLAKLLMRLRHQYFQELAGVRAGHNARMSSINKRHEVNLIIAEVDEDEQYKGEILAARGNERDTAKRIFHSQLDVLEVSTHDLVVQTVVQAGAMIEPVLPFPLLIKSYMDVIRLSGGAEHDETFFLNLFIDVTLGQLDMLVALKSTEVETDHARQLNAYFVDANAALISNTFGRPDTAPAPNPPEQEFVDESVLKKRRREEQASVAPDTEQPPSPSLPPPEEQFEQFADNIKYPCESQFAIPNAQKACSAIALVVAMRLSVAFLLPTVQSAGLISAVEDFIQYDRLLQTGADIWRNWRAAKSSRRAKLQRNIEQAQTFISASLPQNLLHATLADIKKMKIELENLSTDYMLGPEVVAASEYVQTFMAKNEIAATECSGFWSGEAVNFGSESELGEQSASLPRLLETENAKGPFGAVLTIRGSSMCVAYVGDIEDDKQTWYIFDSHGMDMDGKSTLARLPSSKAVMKLVNNTFEELEMSDNESEYTRMRANSYSMFILRLASAN